MCIRDSHTCLQMLLSGFEISIIDSYVNSSTKVLDSLIKLGKEYNKDFLDKINFFKGDIRDELLLDSIFKKRKKPIGSRHEF